MTVTTPPPPPTIELEAPSGERVTVAPRSPDDRVGELADAIGLDPHHPLWLDGRPVGRHDTLARAGLVRGSRLEPGATEDPAVPVPNGAVAVIGEAGPDAGTIVLLGPGRHVVGRAASAAVPIADPALEPHQGVLEVESDGTVRFVQLTGRVPARLAGDPVAPGCVVGPGAPLVLGASRLHVRSGLESTATATATAVVTPTPGDPWQRTLRRSPRAPQRWAPEPIAVPAPAPAAPRPAATGVAAAAFTLAGSVVVALAMGSPMFLLLGAAGGIASLGLWLAARVRAGRDGRRASRSRERDLTTFTTAVARQREEGWRHHLATTPTAAIAVTEATAIGAGVWARRAAHADAFTVTLGWGPVSWELTVDRGGRDAEMPLEVAAAVEAAERFADAPVPTDLGPGTALAITGPAARAVAWSLIVQLATWTGPADWRLVVIAGEPRDWDWCRWLPHATTADGAATVLRADDAERAGALLGPPDADDDRRHVVVVTDRPEILASRTGSVRRFLAVRPSAAVLVAVPPGDAVPAMCSRALEIGSTGLARWRPDVESPAPSGRVHVAGVTAATATRVARRLAALHDPEDPSAAARALPTTLTLSGLGERHGTGAIDDAIAVAGAWRAAGPDPAPAAAIGVAADGVVEIDLARDGPHALVAGTTGSGKSELLRTLVVSLAARSSPDHLTFVLVDYKGGATFDACAELPHTVGVVTDLDERLAARTLVGLDAELRRRERVLRAAGADDLPAYRATVGRPALPRLVVVIDEFAALAAELPGFLSSLVGVAQRGRSLGIHLVLATQRPAGVVNDDIRANTNLRLALRLQDVADARDVVGDTTPAAFPRGTPGRAMLRLGPDETVVFQAARSSGPRSPRQGPRLRVVAEQQDEVSSEESELDVLVRAIRHGAALSDTAPPHRPFLPPLPELIPAHGDGVNLEPGDAGIVDDPAGQRRLPLRWAPDDGHLVVFGALGAGTTTALRTVLAALATTTPPAALHVYAIDATGDRRLDELLQLPHCGAVVRLHERERLGRLLRRLVDELESRRRAGGPDGRPHVVLAVDGVPALRAALDGPGSANELARFARLVGEGAAVGLTCVMTAERPGAMPPALLAACSERWVLRLDDASEAPLAGVPVASTPRSGRGRLVVASTGLEAQLALLEIRPGDATAGGPSPIRTLSPEVDSAELPGGRHRDGATELVVGIDFATLTPAVLTVPDGEHVLVAGPPRSGRTTALRRLVASWRQAHPHGTVHPLDPRAAWPLARVGDPGPPRLIVVDDADRVDDPSGALVALVGERRPGLLVVAAGRPDALRTRYGDWTTVVRRSRTGLLLAACAEIDGDLLGELLPRHPPLPPRPGLAWLVGGGQRALVQIGRATPGPAGLATCRVGSPTRHTDPAT